MGSQQFVAFFPERRVFIKAKSLLQKVMLHNWFNIYLFASASHSKKSWGALKNAHMLLYGKIHVEQKNEAGH